MSVCVAFVRKFLRPSVSYFGMYFFIDVFLSYVISLVSLFCLFSSFVRSVFMYVCIYVFS